MRDRRGKKLLMRQSEIALSLGRGLPIADGTASLAPVRGPLTHTAHVATSVLLQPSPQGEGWIVRLHEHVSHRRSP
jgi:hypothetical protein